MRSTSTPSLHLVLATTLATAALFGACASAGPAGSEPTGSEPTGSEPDVPASVPETVENVPDREDFKNTIRWKTASEVDNFGFDVYRSESEEGQFVRINPEIIEGAGTSDEPRQYEFVDATIDPHKTYFYYVESISMSGTREKFTPVGKAPAKIQSSSER